MKLIGVIVGCAVVYLMGAAVSCEESVAQVQETPKHESVWTGRPGNLAEWGHGKDFIYAQLATQNPDKDTLVLWKWQDDSLKESLAGVLPESLYVVPVSGELSGLCVHPHQKDDPGSYDIIKIKNKNEVIKSWAPPIGYGFTHAGSSTNGSFIALTARVDIGDDTKIGLIDIAKQELRWVSELKGHGAGTIRTVVATDDGRYVAIAGWNNGTAMVDAKEGKVLWAKRPEQEVSTGYAAFAPDRKSIYTAGSEGCVYEIDVTTGNIVSQLWASSNGKSIYAHRVSALALSADGKWLAAGTGPEGEVYVWNLERRGNPRVLQHGAASILIVAFSPDNKNVASVGGGFLKIWPVEAAKK